MLATLNGPADKLTLPNLTNVLNRTAVNRTLAYLIREDGWDYSVEAARAGVAHSYVYGGVPVERYAAIETAQQEANDALRGLWGPPCYGNTDSIAETGPGTETAPAASPVPFYQPPVAAPAAESPPQPQSAYYSDCDEARAAGVAPIHDGEPGYRRGLDRDRDGIACDQ